MSKKTGSVSLNVKSLVRANILGLAPYQSARDTIQEGILLDANENPYPQDWEGIALNRYPDPHQLELRRSLASHLGVEVENVLAGVGSDEVLDWIFKVFCQPGRDAVAITEPTYGMYRVMAQIYGVETVDFPLDAAFDFSASQFLNSVPDRVKLVFLCSPNNPTGNRLSEGEVLGLCAGWSRVVVLDEAYVEFAETPSLASRVQEFSNLIVLRTLSKAFGRAGVRLGYAVASAEMISYFLKVKAPYNVSSIALRLACRALEQGPMPTPQVEEIWKQRARLRHALGSIPEVERVFPSEGNFLLFRCPDASGICRYLMERGIVVRDRSLMPGLDDCLRVSVGTPEENDAFLDALRRLLRERKPGQ